MTTHMVNLATVPSSNFRMVPSPTPSSTSSSISGTSSGSFTSGTLSTSNPTATLHTAPDRQTEFKQLSPRSPYQKETLMSDDKPNSQDTNLGQEQQALAASTGDNPGGSTAAAAVECSESNSGGKTPSGKKSDNLISATKKCKVCGEPAAKHIHYGSVSCFSCRAFFRRSIRNNASNKYTCRRQGKCEINKKTRKSCQKCRFELCLEVGMKPNWVLSDAERDQRFRKTNKKKQETTMSQANNTSASAGASGDPEEQMDEDSCGESAEEEPTQQTAVHGLSPHAPFPSPHVTNMPPTHHVMKTGGVGFLPSSAYPPHMMLPQYHGEPIPGTSKDSAVPFLDPHLHQQQSLPIPPPIYHGLPPLDPRQQQQQQQQSYSFIPSQPMFMPGMGHPSAEGIHGMAPLAFPMQIQGGFLPSSAGVDQPRHNQTHPYYQNHPSASSSFVGGGQQAIGGAIQNIDEYDSDDSGDSTRQKIMMEPALEISDDEIFQIKRISNEHDRHYKSVAFGEELIKEMVICSVFKKPLETSIALKAYRTMVTRVTKVAQGFDHFVDLNYGTQSALLKQNADLLVSLRGAVFFDDKKKGLDQILYSMGVDDIETGKKMIMVTLKNAGNLGRIDYKTFNSIQKIDDNETEKRYEQLLARVGSTVSIRPEIVKLFSYIILFSSDFTHIENRVRVDSIQEMLINMLKRFLFSQYSRPVAVSLFANILHCIGDLRELTHIKKQRAMASLSQKSD